MKKEAIMNEHKSLIFIPTYNERDNVGKMCRDILGLGLESDLLFMDDNSPDGTGEILDRLSEEPTHVHVVHRSGKLGIGSAHYDGINWAYDKGYKILITMDCDFSHSPSYLSEFIKASSGGDAVVGSRFIQKASLKGWSLFRRAMTNIGHLLTKTFLKMPYDATGAYRLYRLDKIPRGIFDIVQARGYSFFYESLYVLHLNGFEIRELPIELPARTYGQSKMKFKDMKHSLLTLFNIYLRTMINQELFILSEPFPGNGNGPSSPQEAQWNQYWSAKENTGSLIYDLIASFYRRFIIRRALNYYIKKHFQRGAKVLHAGCGSGQVDTDISGWIDISAMDISISALNIYSKINKGSAEIVHGDLFHIPAGDETYDGIYNLGVMEHFTDQEIQMILREFHRVSKPDGKLIIFWPPEFGLSVLLLRVVHYFLNTVMKKGVKLHPDEITRVRSKKHVADIVARANFSLEEYCFGMRDAFTYAVIVLSKNQ